MSDFINNIIERAKTLNKTIVLPEGKDERILEAAERLENEGICKCIVLGNSEPREVKELKPELAYELFMLRRHKGMTEYEANELMDDSMYLSMMLLKKGYADGVVAGSSLPTAKVFKPALQIIKCAPNTPLVSTFFVMVVPDCDLGLNGQFMFADCALNVSPNSDELAHIAVQTSKSFEHFFHEKPVVAMLSHSTYGSARNDDATKVREACVKARELAGDLQVDGDIQLDAALVPSVAEAKCPTSKITGRGNVLIFPDLDAGNIGYKLVQRLGKAEAYGPITQGLDKPVNDLSRGCSVDEIIGVTAITCVQAE